MKRIEDINLNNKTVIIRVDYNVPINKNGKIIDDNRIKESLKTINYCLDKNCKIILLSHLGKVKTQEDLKTKSLKVVADRLQELLNKKIVFINQTKGELVNKTIFEAKNKDIILLENTRIYNNTPTK